CGVAGRCEGLDAVFGGQNFSLRPGGSGLDAREAGSRGFCDGSARCASTADETGWENIAVVRNWVRRSHNRVRLVENILVVAQRTFSSWSVRQCECDHPWVDRATGHAG